MISPELCLSCLYQPIICNYICWHSYLLLTALCPFDCCSILFAFNEWHKSRRGWWEGSFSKRFLCQLVYVLSNKIQLIPHKWIVNGEIMSRGLAKWGQLLYIKLNICLSVLIIQKNLVCGRISGLSIEICCSSMSLLFIFTIHTLPRYVHWAHLVLLSWNLSVRTEERFPPIYLISTEPVRIPNQPNSFLLFISVSGNLYMHFHNFFK